MSDPSNRSIVPENKKGKPVNIQHAVTGVSIPNAIDIFERACSRLLNPSVWGQLSGILSASFKLFGKKNTTPDRPLMTGDYIRIDIPGPGSSAGDGYDWVVVESIQENTEQDEDASFAVRVRAAKNPEGDNATTAHFFKAEATSTFLITRKELLVSVRYFGRNEIPNISNVSGTDKLRNAVIATAAIAGISEFQWAALTRGLLKEGPAS